MAVSITTDRLADALKVDSPDTAETAVLARLLKAATALVERYSPNAPVDVQDEAVILVVGYWYDSPTSAAGSGYAHAFSNSGAQALLAPWRIHRAGVVKV